jgi:pyruvate formate lyase activating enzyme
VSGIANTSLSGIIFDIRKYSVHDGPGIRTSVFFKGCPLRCLWCHNPEGLDPAIEVTFRNDRCIRCGSCLATCAEGAVSWIDDVPHTDKTTCVRCGACTETCYTEARDMVGKVMTVDEIMDAVESDIPFYTESGGGVTLSGGEPLMQADLARFLLEACQRKGIHTALDTCGYARWDDLEKVSVHADLILYDLKIIDDEKHRRYIGVSNDIILSNLQNLSRMGRTIIIRIPLIPGINDDNENIHRLGAFAASLPFKHSYELLPYHQLGIHKYNRVSRDYQLSATRPPSEDLNEEIMSTLNTYGLTATEERRIS